jgi:hypothetical protein
MANVWYMEPTENGVSYTEHKLSIIDAIAKVQGDLEREAGRPVEVKIRAGADAFQIISTMPGYIELVGKPDLPVEEGTGRLNSRWFVRRDFDLAPKQIVMDDRLIEIKKLPPELRPVNVNNNLSQLLVQMSGQLELAIQRLEVLEKKAAKSAPAARKRTRRRAA